MLVTINGVATQVADDATVDGLVRGAAEERRSIAVALNGEVVPRAAWQQTRVSEGDSLEVLAATAGG